MNELSEEVKTVRQITYLTIQEGEDFMAMIQDEIDNGMVFTLADIERGISLAKGNMI